MPTERVNSTQPTEPEIPGRDRWKIQIRRCLAQRNLEEAARAASQALDEFPDDSQLLGLEEQVIRWKQRKIQAYLWMDEGKQLCAEGNFQEGLQVLRSAASLDEHDPTPQAALVDALLHAAIEAVENDWHSAAELVLEAIRLDPANPTAKSVLHSVKERERSVLAGNDSAAPPKETATPAGPSVEPNLATERPTGRSTMAVNKQSNPEAVKSTQPIQPVASSPRSQEKARSSARSDVGERHVSERLSSEALNSVPPTPVATAKEHDRRRKPALPAWVLAVAAVVIVAVGGLSVWKGVYGIGLRGTPIQVEIRTIPPGAEVRINGEPHDIARRVPLAAGTYRMEAFLDGYEPAILETTVTTKMQGPVELTLLPARPGLRLSTDLEQGAVFLDDEAVGELQDGQYAIDSLEPGKHSLKVRNSSSVEAKIPFEVLRDEPPLLTGPIAAKNLRVVLVSHHKDQGDVYTNFGPVLATLDGEHLGEVPKTKGLALAGLRSASHQLILGKGRQQQKISLDLAPSGGLFVTLRSDRSVGSIEIVANQDIFDVIVNGKPSRVTKRKDRRFIYNIEAKPVTIQLSKPGYRSDPPEQQITVRKGALTKVTFNLTPIPTTGTLKLPSLLPDTRAAVDGTEYDLNPDGTLEVALKEGKHNIELTRQGYKPKLLRVNLAAGQTVSVEGKEVKVDQKVTGKLVLASRKPTAARVVLRQNKSEIPVSGTGAELPEGNYILVASAAGYHEKSLPVHIAERTPVSVDVNLALIPQPVHMEGWDDQAAWKPENGWYTRKGGMFALFHPSASTGMWQFTARAKGRRFFGSSHIQWVMHYVDENNYELFEIDKENLSWQKVVDGKPGPEMEKPHRASIKNDTYQLQLEISPGGFGGKVFSGDNWVELPTFANDRQYSADARFGLFLPGNDEIWVSGVEFKPME